ncbi:EamA family transporter [Pseudomonas sp. CCI3.2]|uniref:EamA family transporter n=1 Tax=unclassified Pseudomonas TaxID=196821 RepID=UPI002AC94864|nr:MULTISPECIES: EamA family transporter [unclassified Pseudomonas]MEB0077903.1 EamA family transporter [Pseudomonas sp. MH10out]MEB0102799.1 EamA family transporter [Pseudomonas sp. CCI3.2]MEB0131723.1 EamA family transporter [Pseudomonas sp. CCI2.4]MEB0159494.1 EamA family transporter [Pseudomonas sp. AH2 (2023)]MEB0170251.1 EamA family transporter [Pseudomonas sp. CCC4.4]
MSMKDALLALLVVIVWGLNFVVIKIGLHDMPPFLLAGLRFSLVAIPAVFFVRRPSVPLRWMFAYGIFISFGQFAFLFLAIKMGMPAGIASLVIQTQAFFTMILGSLLLTEKLKFHHLVGMLVASVGIGMLAKGGMEASEGSSITLSTLLLTLGAALSWAFGNITNKIIVRNSDISLFSLVVWSALIPIIPFFGCSWIFEGSGTISESLAVLSGQTILSLIYLALFATVFGYAVWGYLLKKYETWRIAPLSLLVPIVGIVAANLILGESLSMLQVAGAVIVLIGLLFNIYGASVVRMVAVRS